MSEGYIYVLINACIPGAVKIGITTRTAEHTARELSQGTGVPTPYVVAFEEEVFNCGAAEVELYRRLEEYRINDDREFFQLPLRQAIREVMRLAEEFRERKRQLDEMDRARTEQLRNLAHMPCSESLVTRPLPSSPEPRCQHCHSLLPSHIRGLYYSVCPKCGKTTYTTDW